VSPSPGQRTTTKTLRIYEEQRLLPVPERSPSGYQDYSPDGVGRLDFIDRGRTAGLTLAQIRQPLFDIRDQGDAPCAHVRHLLDNG